MTSIVTRTGKGAPLSISELDANFTNLNTDKVEKTRIVGAASGELTVTNGGALNQDITLGLPNTGVSAGTLNNSATQTTPFTVDAKGRITGTSAPVTLAPAFASLTNTPTTLAGYGITDAQPTITGAATTIDTEDLTASRALVSDANGKVAAASVTATELGYLANVTQNLQTQLNGKQSTEDKDKANGYAGLNSDGKLSDIVLPNLAISEYLGEVADETAMLALTGQKGDWCTRTDVGTIYIITGNPASAGGWMQLSYPGTPVTSVAGKTGAVTLAKGDVGLGEVDNTSDATKNSATVTLTNKTISGSSNTLSNIGNSSLTNSSITFGSTAVSLGGTVSALNGVSLGQSAAAAGSFTTLSASSTVTLSGLTASKAVFTNANNQLTSTGTVGTAQGGTGLTSFTANGVVYASSTSALTTGTGLVFDGTNLGIGANSPGYNLDIGNTSSTNNFTQRIVSGASAAAMARYDLSGTGTFTVGFNNSGGSVNNAPTGTASLWMQQAYPIVFGTSGIERMCLDVSGNLGLGVTPSAWTTGGNARAIQFPLGYTSVMQASGGDGNFLSNAYLSAPGVYSYVAGSLGASRYQSDFGVHAWYTAPSGTADAAISFTQAMTLDASANLVVAGNLKSTTQTITSDGNNPYNLGYPNAITRKTQIIIVSGTTTTCSVSLNSMSANSPAILRVRCAGSPLGGGTYGAAESIYYLRHIAGGTTGNIETTAVTTSAGLVLTIAYGTASVTVTATVASGVYVMWDVELTNSTTGATITFA